MTATEIPVEPELVFRLDDETGQLWAELQSDENSKLCSADEFGQQLKDSEYSGFYILEPALQELANHQANSTEKFEVIVAEKRHAEVDIRVDDDSMQAFITITPACGGEAVTEDQINLTIRKLVITEGILAEKIPQLVKAGQAENELIARGTPPTHGDDARLENLLPVIKGRHPEVNKDGSVNFRELGQFVVVKPGDALMRKIPLTYGSSGANIYGQVVSPRKGEDINFNALSGTRISPDDPNLLIARIAGQPISHDDGIEVDPTLSVDNVDLNTGNVDFDGSVYVNGNVISGMLIKTTGDIFIEGSVEASNLEAGGDITIKKGFIGRGSVRDDEDNFSSHVAKAQCGGRFTAKFIGNVVVNAGKEIDVEDLVSHSEITAGEIIVVGSGEGNARGCVWGGVSEAGLLFKAHSLGSSASVKTSVQVGNVKGMKMRFLKMEEERKHKEEEKIKLSTLVKKLETEGAANKVVVDSAKTTLALNTKELNELVQKKKELVTSYKSRMGAKVVVDKEIYNGVQMNIGMDEYDVTDRKGPCTFSLTDNRIVVRYT